MRSLMSQFGDLADLTATSLHEALEVIYERYQRRTLRRLCPSAD